MRLQATHPPHFSYIHSFLQPLTAFEGFSFYVDILEKEKNGFRDSWIGTT